MENTPPTTPPWTPRANHAPISVPMFIGLIGTAKHEVYPAWQIEDLNDTAAPFQQRLQALAATPKLARNIPFPTAVGAYCEKPNEIEYSFGPTSTAGIRERLRARYDARMAALMQQYGADQMEAHKDEYPVYEVYAYHSSSARANASCWCIYGQS